MEDKLYTSYVSQIQKYPLLDSESEFDLACKIQNGSKSAFFKLVNSNLRLVVSIAYLYGSGKPYLMDLIQEGNIALMTAAKKYEQKFGVRFSTYAYSWIQQAMIRYVQKKLPQIAIPYRKDEQLRNIKKTDVFLAQKLGRSPTTKETSVYLGMSEAQIAEIKSYDYSIVSDVSISNNNSVYNLLDLISDVSFAPEHVFFKADCRRSIIAKLKKLPEFEYKVIYYRYNIGKDRENWSLRKIGDLLGVSPETIRQAELRALNKLRMDIKQKDILSA